MKRNSSPRKCIIYHIREEKEDAAGIDVTNCGLSSFQESVQIPFVQTKVTDHWTQPPKPFTEDTLLHAMENAGTEEMESDVERKGLGTPATRAGIIDKLVTSNYITRKKKHLAVTPEGRQLISILPDYLKSAGMTSEWENRLLQVERGQYDSRAFLDGIIQMISRMLQECRQAQSPGNSRPFEDKEGRKERAGQEDSGKSRPFGDKEGRKERAGHEDFGKCPVCGAPVYESEKSFYCSDRNCRFILWKQSSYFDKWRVKLDSRMVRDLLTDGRTTVTNLYSQKKNKHFTADLVMEWQDGRAVFSLEFPKDSKGGQGS